MLDRKEEIHAEDLANHTNCVLGKWYYKRGKENFGNLPEFAAIEEPHRQFHQRINDIVNAFNQNRISEKDHSLEDIERISNNVVTAIGKFEVKIKSHNGNGKSFSGINKPAVVKILANDKHLVKVS
jgi:hypothetical protein